MPKFPSAGERAARIGICIGGPLRYDRRNLTKTGRDDQPALTVFALLWAVATLFHVSALGNLGPQEAVLASAAVLLLCWPRSAPLLLCLAGLQLYDVAVHLPTVSNHWLFTACVNLTILAAAFVRPRAGGGAWFRAFAPVLRWELLALYAFVVLHKLNADYFTPAVSCGAVFYRAQAERFTFLPVTPGFEAASIYLTVIVEAAIPLMLAARRTRNAGIVIAVVFHSAVAFNPISGFYNFAALMLAMLALFVPSSFLTTVEAWWKQTGITPAAARTGVLTAAAVAGLLLLSRTLTPLPFFAVYSLALIALFVSAWGLRPRALAPEPGVLKVHARALLLVPALVVLNGTSPYLGLKTETSFAMFSNLRTEGGTTNHLFIPASTQLFDFQRVLVAADRADEVMPAFERDRREGRAPWVAGKLLWFSPLRREGRQTCRH